MVILILSILRSIAFAHIFNLNLLLQYKFHKLFEYRRNIKKKTIKQHKKRVNYTINKHTIDRFKVVADKDMRKMSNIVENLIRRYVESRV